MPGRPKMRIDHVRSALRLAVVLLIFYLIQVTILARFRLWGAMPLPLPLLAMAAGLGGGGIWGGCFGLAVGIVCDSSLEETSMLFTVLLTVLGFFSGFLGEFVLARGFPSFLVLSLAGLVLCTGLQMLFFSMLIPTSWRVLLITGAKQLVLTLPFIIPAYLSVRWALRPSRAAKQKNTFTAS